MQIDLQFHGKMSRQKYYLRHKTFAKLILWSDLLDLNSSSSWSFLQHSTSFINLSLAIESFTVFALCEPTGHWPSNRDPTVLGMEHESGGRRRGLHFILYFLRQFNLSDHFFFRYSKGLAFTYYEKTLDKLSKKRQKQQFYYSFYLFYAFLAVFNFSFALFKHNYFKPFSFLCFVNFYLLTST